MSEISIYKATQTRQIVSEKQLVTDKKSEKEAWQRYWIKLVMINQNKEI